MARTVIGVTCTDAHLDTWRVTVNGRVPSDARGYSRERAEQEARQCVAAYPNYRQLDPAVPKESST